MEDIIGIRKQIIPPKIDLIRTGQHGYRFTLSSVPDLGQTRPCEAPYLDPEGGNPTQTHSHRQ